MSRIKFRGFSPDSSNADEQRRQNDLLIENIDLIRRYADRILEQEEWFYCEPAPAFLSVAYIGGGQVYLGILLTLWGQQRWKQSCPYCSDEVLVVGAGGSPLSGTNSWWGICTSVECRAEHPREFVRGGNGSLGALLGPVRELQRQYSNPWYCDPPPPPQPWSWTKTPKYVEPPKPWRRVQAASLEDVIVSLNTVTESTD